MLQLLSNIQPIIIIVVLILMYSLENVWPYFEKPANRKKHDRQNFIIGFISFGVNGGMAVLVTSILEFTANHHLGLLNNIPINPTLGIIIGIFLSDFSSYITHIAQHKIPLLWRSHRIHHSDPNLNALSTLRFHPFDVVISQGLSQCIFFPLFGVSIASFIIYSTFFLPLFIIQHSNLKLPDWFEKYARYFISTPGWHKIHHAADQQYTDSHYGCFFTLWDRLFGTWSDVDPASIEYGLHEFKDDRQHSVGYMLMAPFKNLKRK